MIKYVALAWVVALVAYVLLFNPVIISSGFAAAACAHDNWKPDFCHWRLLSKGLLE